MRPGTLLGPAVDPWVATTASLAVGGGLVLALAGGVAGDLPWLALGGGAVATGLAVLVAAGWLDGPVLAALSVPLPALVSDEGLRVAGAAPIAAVVLAGWAWTFAAPRPRFDPGRIPVTPAVVLLAAWVVSALFADAPLVSARETLNLLLLVLLLVACVDLFRRRPASREDAVTVLAALAALTGGLAVLETAGVLPAAFPRTGTSLYRAALGFGQPNGLGLFLAMSIPLVLHRRATARGAPRAWWGLALLLAVAGLVGTFSRGSWLAVLGGAGALALVGAGRRALRVWVGALVLAGLADLASGGAIRDTVERTAGDWVIEQRAALALTGVVMYADHPVTGVGPGGFAEALDEYGALVPALEDLQPTPHNAYVQAAAETGTVGLAAFLLVIVAAGVVLVRSARSAPRLSDAEASLRRAVLWSMATVALAGMVIWPLAHGYGEAVVLILGVGLSARDPGELAPAEP
jgi:O-antigen ligase